MSELSSKDYWEYVRPVKLENTLLKARLELCESHIKELENELSLYRKNLKTYDTVQDLIDDLENDYD
jgi:hypothetical protein